MQTITPAKSFVRIGMILGAMMAISQTVFAGSLFDKLRGTDIGEGMKAYADCVLDLQNAHSDLSDVVILEGLANEVGLEMRRNRRFITADEAASLTGSHKQIKKCRKALKKAARRSDGVMHVLTTTFEFNDGIYADILDSRLFLSDANDLLHKSSERMLYTVAKLERIDDGVRQGRSAEGWEMMRKGLDSMNPSSPPVTTNPNYHCYSNGSTTNCTPVDNGGGNSGPRYTCYTSNGVTNCTQMQ